MWFTVGLLVAIFGAAYFGAKYGGLTNNHYLRFLAKLSYDEAAKARRAAGRMETLLVAAAKHSVAEGKAEVEKALAEFQSAIATSELWAKQVEQIVVREADKIEDKVESVAKTVVDKIKKVL